MAKTIARAFGYDKTRIKEVHRLGSIASRVQANTWRTFAEVLTRADGSGSVVVKRDGKTIHFFKYEPE